MRIVSRSGATTADMTESQRVKGGMNQPQFRAMNADTQAVSSTIGAKDIGFIAVMASRPSSVNADKEQQLNAMIKYVAHTSGAFYVDTYAGSIGRDACHSPTVRWVEPFVPVNAAAPVHPDAAGMRAAAKMLLAAMHRHGL